MTASGKWQPGALRQAITTELGSSYRGVRAGELAQRTGWSAASVRRELSIMEQMGLIRSAAPASGTGQAALWFQTRAGQILWLLAHQGEQRTPVLARSLGTSEADVHAEAVRLVQLGVLRGRPDGGTRAWRLAGKPARPVRQTRQSLR